MVPAGVRFSMKLCCRAPSRRAAALTVARSPASTTPARTPRLLAEHEATPVDAGHAQPIRLRAVLQAGFDGNLPGWLRQLPIAQSSRQIPGEDHPLHAPFSALEFLYF